MKTVNFDDLYPLQPTSPTPSVERLSKPVGSGLSRIGRTLKKWLIADQEIQITQIIGQDGQTWWRVYHPRTQQLQWMTSESEVRLWLDTTRHR